MNNNIEIRFADLSANVEDRTISGVGISVNSRSVLLAGEFYEMIAPEAVSQEFVDTQDVRVLYNHVQDGFCLARSRQGSGSLKLESREDGLHFTFEAPKSAWADHILEEIRRGDISNCSFGFVVGEDEWRKLANGVYERTIRSFDALLEISLCDVPTAYDTTSVSCRSLEAFKEKETRDAQEDELKRLEEAKKKEEEEAEIKKQKEEEEARRKEELEKYYSELKSKLD